MPRSMPSNRWLLSARQLSPTLSSGQIELLALFRDRILTANAQFNLTALRTADEIDDRLLLESVRLKPLLQEAIDVRKPPVRVVDIGTGAGIPGIPLAILFPESEFSLIDATAKKVRFVDEAIEALGLTNATAIHGRIEELARETHWRETRDIVVARAVGSLATLLELAVPILKVGGVGIFPKGIIDSSEWESAKSAAEMLGARLAEPVELESVEGCPVTHVALADKLAPVIDRYPRRSGLPARDPLGG